MKKGINKLLLMMSFSVFPIALIGCDSFNSPVSYKFHYFVNQINAKRIADMIVQTMHIILTNMAKKIHLVLLYSLRFLMRDTKYITGHIMAKLVKIISLTNILPKYHMQMIM